MRRRSLSLSSSPKPSSLSVSPRGQAHDTDDISPVASRFNENTAQFERIFQPSELAEMEGQITVLIEAQKQIKKVCKEEIRNTIVLLDQAGIRAQQHHDLKIKKEIDLTTDLLQQHIRHIEDEVDKDMALLSEQEKSLKALRFEKDYWKELELKSVVGDERIENKALLERVAQGVEETVQQFRAVFETLNALIQEEKFEAVQGMLREYLPREE